MASLGVCSPLRKEADTRQGSLGTRDAGLGLRAGDTAWAGSPGGGYSSSPGEKESRPVPQSQGRGFRAGAPGLLALRDRGWGDTPESRAAIDRGYRRGVSDRRGAGEELGGLPPGLGPWVGSVCGPAGRPEVWGRGDSRSAVAARHSRPHFPLLPAPSLQ